MDSILNSVKKIVDIDPSNTAFDDQLIIHINTALNVLRQLGVGDDEYPLIIEDKDDTWGDLDEENRYPIIKSYIPLKVRTLFDPPTGGSLSKAYEAAVNELEWRIIVESTK